MEVDVEVNVGATIPSEPFAMAYVERAIDMDRPTDRQGGRMPSTEETSLSAEPSQLTPRGRRTRTALIDAAAAVFARDGFLDCRIADIAKTAGVAHGTFYTYFSSKEEIFQEVIFLVQRDMASHDDEPPAAADEQTPWQLVETANRRYITAYRRNARLMATLEQVATFNDDVRKLRLELRDRFVLRNTKAIQRWQRAGIADPDVDAGYAANALGTMVDRFAYTWFVLGQSFDEERAIETLTRLWLQSLGIEHGRHRKKRKPR
jgi:AcrR family transcriptional regulator